MSQITLTEVKAFLIQMMCDAGELINKGDDYYEDMGGHLIHETNLDGYIEQFTSQMSEAERESICEQLEIP